jgi:hypothetical protein
VKEERRGKGEEGDGEIVLLCVCEKTMYDQRSMKIDKYTLAPPATKYKCALPLCFVFLVLDAKNTDLEVRQKTIFAKF